jgi:hypothetical protein
VVTKSNLRWFWELRAGNRTDRFVFWVGGAGLAAAFGALAWRLAALVAFIRWGAQW